jgi:hypothetical protein
MIVTPIPIGLLIPGVEPVKISVFAMSFLDPHMIGPIFVVIPDMFIVVLRILVFALLIPMVVLGQCCARKNRDWAQQSGTQQAYTVAAS